MRPPVLESNNQYSILPIEDANDSSVENDDRVVRAPPKLTKRPASSSSRVKASNEKMTTISSPILTMMHQWRPPFKPEFQAAVTNARSDGAGQAPSANPDEAALLVGKVPPWGSSYAASSEGIGRGAETSPGTEWIARTSQLKSPGKKAAATKTFPSHDQSRGLHPQKHELLTTEGRSGTPNEMQDPMEARVSYEGRRSATRLVSPLIRCLRVHT